MDCFTLKAEVFKNFHLIRLNKSHCTPRFDMTWMQPKGKHLFCPIRKVKCTLSHHLNSTKTNMLSTNIHLTQQ